MTRDKFDTYVSTLSKDVREIFRRADTEVTNNPDTLSEEFQIASAVVDVFEKRAKQSQLDHSDYGDFIDDVHGR